MPEPTRYVICHSCGLAHEATLSHISPYGGHRVYAVVCTTDDWVTDYYTEESTMMEAE